ncbi:MAG: amino acid-binding protein [Desulfuromonadales bacterium GWD2_61_12]|nr:MAG: amino acid-binding protein [Desulfuromonadales bacterium GWD2_61_12]
MHHYALTVIGRDRPGIIAQVTEILYKLGCNIADSSCTLLGGQYAMIMIVAHPTIASKEEMAAHFAPLEQVKLTAFVRKIDEEAFRCVGIGGEICMISVYGADRPGIVYRVTKELAERQVNISDLNSKLVGSEERPVYVMMLETILPDSISEEEIKQVMQHLATEMKVDISVRSITPVEL